MIKGINLEAEMDILSVVLNNEHILVENSDKWVSTLFSDPFHVKIVETIKKNVIEGVPIEISTLSSNTNEQNAIRSIKLRDKAPEFFDDFYKVLEECLIHRELDKLRKEIKLSLDDDKSSVSPSTVLSTIKSKIENLEELRTSSVYTAQDIIGSVLGKYLEIYDLAQKGIEYRPSDVIRTPFKGLNRMLKSGGFLGGNLVMIAASTSTGKSELAINIASYASIVEDKTAFVYSLEMTKESLMTRILLSESKVDSYKLENGKLTEDNLINLKKAADSIGECNMIFEDNLSGEIFNIITSIRKVHAKTPLDLVVIDYIQLIETSLSFSNTTESLSMISRTLKKEAVRMNIPFLVLSQISRKSIQEGREPDLSSLRGSGSLEHDSDMCIFLHVTDKERRKNDLWKTKLLLSKNREGETGEIYLENNKTIQTFVEIEEIDYKGASIQEKLEQNSIPF